MRRAVPLARNWQQLRCRPLHRSHCQPTAVEEARLVLDLLIRITENVIIVVGGPSLEEGTVMGVPPASSTTTPPAGAGNEPDRIDAGAVR